MGSGCAVVAQWLRSGCAVVAQWLPSDLMFFSFLCQLEGKRYMELIGGLWRTLGFLGGEAHGEI